MKTKNQTEHISNTVLWYMYIYIYIYYILLSLLLVILLLTVRKCLLRVGVRCVQCNRQKFHFSIDTGHRCYSKNERLGRFSYYYINFFSFHFVWTATLDCNFFFFSVHHHNLICTHYFCRGLLWELTFLHSFFWNKPLI